MKKFFQLGFLPASADLALLVLRLGFGGLMAVLHGWPKLMGFERMFHNFGDPLGIGKEVSYVLVVLAELVGAALVVIGLGTRFAALLLVITMGVAFFIAHGGALSGEGSGEMALLFLLGFLAILVGGPGRFSLDNRGSGTSTLSRPRSK